MDADEYEVAHDGTDPAAAPAGGAGDAPARTRAEDGAVDVADETAGDRDSPAVERPLDLLRIGTLVQTMLAEVRGIDLDEPGRARLAQLHGEALGIVRRAVSPDLEKELGDLVSSFDEDRTPTQAELRVAQAELAGWLQGLFHGIQATAMSRGEGVRGDMGPAGALPSVGGPTGYL